MNGKIDTKEDIEDVVTHECLLNVTTYSFFSGRKLTYIELDSGSSPETSRQIESARTSKREKTSEILTSTRRTYRKDRRGRSSDPSASRDGEYGIAARGVECIETRRAG